MWIKELWTPRAVQQVNNIKYSGLGMEVNKQAQRLILIIFKLDMYMANILLENGISMDLNLFLNHIIQYLKKKLSVTFILIFG